jgi:malate dehydrogenase (oxaloacetate-decarboxylating)
MTSASAAVETGRSGRRFEERVDPRTGEKYRAVFVRGEALTVDPLLNKGTCFTPAERDAFGLRGILPPAVSTPEDQARRAYENYLRAPDDVSRYVFLAALQDRNETLFHRLLLEHLQEMVPIVYTPTVGRICEQYSHMYRRPRGVYVSSQDRGRLAEVLANADRWATEIIVVTDNEAILGIGDQGIGGMGIAIGKLALYTVGAGIHPGHGLPLTVDVGTDNQNLLQDPLYLGVRHARLRGEAYFTLLDELAEAIGDVFPGAIVQWEDFASERAFDVLGRYRRRLPSFDDDIQGTAAVVEAGVRTALARVGRRLGDERVVFYGAGAAGAGCALQLRRAMRGDAAIGAQISDRVLCLDSRGLILHDRPGLSGYKVDIAAAPTVVAGWTSPSHGMFGLSDVVRQFKPTILVGVSGQAGAFTEEIVRTMASGCERPIILPLSNPTNRAEAVPGDLLGWTRGAAVVGTGSPFPPVRIDGVNFSIGQCNNAFVFPGIGLGARVVGARWLPDDVFAAAARAVHEFAGSDTQPGASIYPPISALREVSRHVAVAVARAIVGTGEVPALTTDAIEGRVAAAMWQPEYRPYRVA